MIKISDMIVKDDIEKLKKESQYALLKEQNIQAFLKQNHLDPSVMDDYWVEFLDYNDDFHAHGYWRRRFGFSENHEKEE